MTTRRDFLATSGTAAGAAWLARLAPLLGTLQACAADAVRDDRPFTTFSDREGADFDAFAARIVPTDDTPGAREAGSVHFADQALGGVLADLLPIVRGGLASLSERAAAFGTDEPFADLGTERQDEIITAVEQEDPGFFFFARTLVVVGLVSNPEYGGNRDGMGWSILGFDDTYRYEPPFGYYDRDEHGAGAEG